MPNMLITDECFVTEPVVLDKKALDFSAEGYYKGKRIKVRLSDLRNKWVVLFFYASDFTFV